MMRGLHGQALKVVQDCFLSGLNQPLFTCCMVVCLVREPVARTVCVHACPCVCVCVYVHNLQLVALLREPVARTVIQSCIPQGLRACTAQTSLAVCRRMCCLVVFERWRPTTSPNLVAKVRRQLH